MEKQNPNFLRKFTDKLFGGLNMSWLSVILFAVGTAILSAVFLTVPIFFKTSFMRMGETFEAWIFFAVIIMSNCKKPLESALKTFVFFLISQPLIYLFQVPFSDLGWGLFMYYKYWFIWTLFTFPMAFVGWFITKRNWISLLILSPVLAFLGYTALEAFRTCISSFPKMIVTGLFCVIQILFYVFAFLPKLPQRLIGAAIPIVTVAVIILIAPKVDLTANNILPGDPELTENSVISLDRAELAEVSLSSYEDDMITIHAHDFGTGIITINTDKTSYYYEMRIYYDSGIPRIDLRTIE